MAKSDMRRDLIAVAENLGDRDGIFSLESLSGIADDTLPSVASGTNAYRPYPPQVAAVHTIEMYLLV